MKPLLLYQQTGKSAKTRSAKASADAPQASQAKRKGPKSTKLQAKRQKTAPPYSPPPVPTIYVESSPSSPQFRLSKHHLQLNHKKNFSHSQKKYQLMYTSRPPIQWAQS